MAFHIKVDDVRAVNYAGAGKAQDMMKKLNDIGTAIMGLADAPGFTGQAASSAKSYLGEVHGTLIGHMQKIFQEYCEALEMYEDGYSQIDGDNHAEFTENSLGQGEAFFRSRTTEFSDEAYAIEQAVERVADLIDFVGPRNAGQVFSMLQHAERQESQMRETVGSYEAKHGHDLADVKSMMAAVNSLIANYVGSHGSIVSTYRAGDIGGLPQYATLRRLDGVVDAKQKDRAPYLAEAYKREEQRTKELNAEAAKEREKQGWIKCVMAVVTIAVGVIATVATCGAAAPLFVGLAIASVGFGASDLFEGAQDIYYGAKGDTTSKAFNPIRDTVFQGNQQLYDMTEFAVTTFASAGAGLVKSGVQVTAKATVKAFARDMAEGLVSQKASEVGGQYFGEGGAIVGGMLAGHAMGKLRGGEVHAANLDTTSGAASAAESVRTVREMPEITKPPVPRAEIVVTGESLGRKDSFIKDRSLEADTRYVVEGRGAFYTDSTGTVTHIEAEYGTKGQPNPELNNPQANVTYIVHPRLPEELAADGLNHDHIFVTDSQSRTVVAHTDNLVLTTGVRYTGLQRLIGKIGGPTGYDGGHMIGTQFGGGGERINVRPQDSNINRGVAGNNMTFAATERAWASDIKDGKNVSVTIHDWYDGESKVHTKSTATWQTTTQAQEGEGRPSVETNRRNFKNVQ